MSYNANIQRFQIYQSEGQQITIFRGMPLVTYDLSARDLRLIQNQCKKADVKNKVGTCHRQV